ncbi:DUF6542 domain-containing protein [Mycobacterium shimoidei]|uniref:DUF6542 domain-containing protein n=1 Tax=Mycobacterium shimoidei TaxID=29313 RepID=UPI0015F05ECF
MSAQRGRPAVTASRRSIYPNLPGVPWWAAVVVAVTATAAGFAFDAGSGNKELTNVFSALYVVGCVVAVLAVQQAGVFTAVIQPPLILFCAVPGAYWLFHGAKITGLKDLLINCGYPLIERFPLMLFTSAGVLLIGMIRWYLGMSVRSTASAEEAKTTDTPKPGIIAKFVTLFGRDPAVPEHTRKSTRTRRTEAAGRPTKSSATRAAKRPATTRTRRPALDEMAEPTRRRRSTRSRDVEPPEAPRRSRVPRDPDLRGRPPREIRREPHVRRTRGTGSPFDPHEPDGYERVRPAEPRRRSPSTPSSGSATHHPISRVRYRGAARTDDPRKPWDYED